MHPPALTPVWPHYNLKLLSRSFQDLKLDVASLRSWPDSVWFGLDHSHSQAERLPLGSGLNQEALEWLGWLQTLQKILHKCGFSQPVLRCCSSGEWAMDSLAVFRTPLINSGLDLENSQGVGSGSSCLDFPDWPICSWHPLSAPPCHLLLSSCYSTSHPDSLLCMSAVFHL